MAKRTLADALIDAVDGLGDALRTQPNFRIQISLAGAAIGGGFALHFGPSRWTVLAVAVGLVLVAELFNTAIERVVDIASPGHDLMARSAKHASAAAVLLAALTAAAAAIWLYVGAWLRW